MKQTIALIALSAVLFGCPGGGTDPDGGDTLDGGDGGSGNGAGLPVRIGDFGATPWGITSNGYAVFTQPAASGDSVMVVPVAGGTPTPVATVPSGYGASILGQLVYAGETTGVGPVNIWTASNGSRRIARSVFGAISASSDGAFITYADQPSAGTYRVWGAPTDLGAENLLMTSSCVPSAEFSGGRALLRGCEGGNGVVASFAPTSSWSRTSLLSDGNAPRIKGDHTGTSAVIVDMQGFSPGPAYFVDQATGTSTHMADAVEVAHIAPDGASAVYVKSDRLYRFTVSGGTVELNPDFPGDFIHFSPSHRYASYFKIGYSSLGDFHFTDMQTPSPGETLVSTETGVFLRSNFTQDEAFVIYGDDPNAEGIEFPAFFRGITGGTTQQLGQRIENVYATRGSWILYTENVVEGGSEPDRVTLKIRNLTGTLDAILVATDVGRSTTYVQTDGSHAVYRIIGNAAPAGVYVVRLP